MDVSCEGRVIGKPVSFQVLILVVMDVSCETTHGVSKRYSRLVLILVVMDVSCEVNNVLIGRVIGSLNPCCNGCLL